MKAKKPRSKRRSNRNLLFRLAAAGVIVYAGVSILSLQAEVRRKKVELEELTQKCDEQALENRDLEMRISAGDDEDYIVNIAREKLDYVYPYERVFVNAFGG